MKSESPLVAKTIKELQIVARKAGIAGWHDLRKNALIEAIEQGNVATSSVSKTKPHQAQGKAKRNAAPASGVSTKQGTKKSVSHEDSPKSAPGKISPPASSPPVTEGKRRPVRKKAPEKPAGIAKKPSPSPQAKTDTQAKGPALTEKAPKPQAPIRKKAPPKKLPLSADSSVPAPALGKKIPQSTSKNDASAVPAVKEQKQLSKTNIQNTAPAAAQVQLPPAPDQQATTEVQKKISALKDKLLLHKTLGTDSSTIDREPRNQLILMVRDPFWLHAYWEMSMQVIDRIRAAMGHLWHTADPILRLYRMHTDAGGTMRKEFLSDIHIHGGINNWYIDVDDPPSSFLVEIGYLARDGQFFILLSSNIVETPQRYVHDSFGHPDVSWTGIPTDFQLGNYPENGGDVLSGNGAKHDGTSRSSGWSDSPAEFGLKIDAELVIKGETTPHVQVAIKGENIRLKEDGTFSIRYHLPERRHVFPIAAVSPDGVETRTIILAVERNTKVLETVVRDEDDE